MFVREENSQLEIVLRKRSYQNPSTEEDSRERRDVSSSIYAIGGSS